MRQDIASLTSELDNLRATEVETRKNRCRLSRCNNDAIMMMMMLMTTTTKFEVVTIAVMKITTAMKMTTTKMVLVTMITMIKMTTTTKMKMTRLRCGRRR